MPAIAISAGPFKMLLMPAKIPLPNLRPRSPSSAFCVKLSTAEFTLSRTWVKAGVIVKLAKAAPTFCTLTKLSFIKVDKVLFKSLFLSIA